MTKTMVESREKWEYLRGRLFNMQMNSQKMHTFDNPHFQIYWYKTLLLFFSVILISVGILIFYSIINFSVPDNLKELRDSLFRLYL